MRRLKRKELVSAAGRFETPDYDVVALVLQGGGALGLRRARDDGGVQRADRDTRHPVRPDAGFMQALSLIHISEPTRPY